MLRRLDDALVSLRADEAVNWTAAYLKAGFDRAALVETLAGGSAKTGNDPHNQELGVCLLEDYAHSTAPDRDRLLLASAKHTAGHGRCADHRGASGRLAGAFAPALERSSCRRPPPRPPGLAWTGAPAAPAARVPPRFVPPPPAPDAPPPRN